MKKRVISSDKILETAFNIVVKDGIDCINARSLAKEINCSTQPIYLCFTNMNDLKNKLLVKCKAFFMEYLLLNMNNNESLFMKYLVSYIKFAYEYPKIYEFMFLKMENENSLSTKEFNDAIIKGIAEVGHYSYDIAERFFLQSFIYAHGLATQIVTGYIKWDFNTINELLKDEFEALKLRYKENKENGSDKN